MISSAFNPDTFMNQTTTDANDTKFTPIPVGEYRGVIDAVEPRDVNGKPVLDIKWKIHDETVARLLGIETPIARQTLWLDLTEQGGLDNGKGKNVGLGKLRAALGQNEAGRPWGPGMLIGQAALVNINHTMGKDKSGKDGEIYANVKAVTAL